MTQPEKSENKQELAKNQLGLLALVMLSWSGILVAGGPLGVGGPIAIAGPGAIWPGIIGFIFFLVVSLPILEYTKIVPFAGGYYGLAELGFGRAWGKFTALANYIYYIWWQAANAFYTTFIITDTIYYLYHYLLPFWAWALIALLTLIVTQGIVSLHVKWIANLLIWINIVAVTIELGMAFYVIAKTPFLHYALYYLNPANAYGGWSGIALAVVATGYWTYVGYGSLLFYSEEAKHGTRDVWRAIYISLGTASLVEALFTFSVLIAVPPSKLSAISSTWFANVPAWLPYFGVPALLTLNMSVAAITIISYTAGGGSQARLLWAMARDNFFRSNWLKKLSKRKSPINAIIVNFITSAVVTFAVAAGIIAFYGYSAPNMTMGFYAVSTAGSITWYFHHFIPEFGYYGYLRRHKVKVSKSKKLIVGLIVPIIAMIFFGYTFYQGIVSNLVEPYLALMIAGLVSVIGAGAYVAYKAKTNSLGESVVEYMVAELGKGKVTEEGKV